MKKKYLRKVKGTDIKMAMGMNRLLKTNRLLCKEKKAASQSTELLVIILIVVIVGAALMAIMKTAMPDLFSDIIDKIKDVFEV